MSFDAAVYIEDGGVQIRDVSLDPLMKTRMQYLYKRLGARPAHDRLKPQPYFRGCISLAVYVFVQECR